MVSRGVVFTSWHNNDTPNNSLKSHNWHKSGENVQIKMTAKNAQLHLMTLSSWIDESMRAFWKTVSKTLGSLGIIVTILLKSQCPITSIINCWHRDKSHLYAILTTKCKWSVLQVLFFTYFFINVKRCPIQMYWWHLNHYITQFEDYCNI